MSTTVDHPVEASNFLKNQDRAKWHDNSLWFVRSKRDKAAALVPEWELLRETASNIKLHMLTHMAEHLEQFEANCQKNGIVVHWAEDAEEHNRIVHGLLEERNLTRVVKSKSMLTEECHLNPYLQDRGIDVIDTDLGERIVQMLDEPPSHIVMPAIHIKKEEIGDLFHEKLDTEAGSADPQYLTEAARQHLRAKFLAGDAAITGVNFAIADTGGIVICTNEGNADLGIALPKIHIACMGMEKLIPRFEDLGVFTRLLARSGTGQPITVYTSHFHGPRPGAEMHIVILNNGRSKMLGRPQFFEALKCIRCGACMNTCPIYRRSGGHSYGATIPGPIGSILSPGTDVKKYSKLPFASSLCGSCTDVCPVRIPLHDQLLAWRKEIVDAGHLPLSKRIMMKFAGFTLARPSLYKFAGRGAVIMKFVPKFLLRHNAWGRQRELPLPTEPSFREQYKARQQVKEDSQ